MNILTFLRHKITHFRGEWCWPREVPIDGIHVLLRGTKIGAGSRRRLMLGGYETAEREMVRKYIDAGDHVLEVGASVGVVSSVIGRMIGDQGNMVCVEADEELADGFHRQLHRNGISATLITGMCCPIWRGDVPEEMELKGFDRHGDSLDGSMGGDHLVKWMTLSEAAAIASFEPSVIVVDVEGAETVWLDRGPGFPASVRLVIAELHWNVLKTEGMAKAVNALQNEGFVIAGIRGAVFAFVRKDGH